MRTKGVAQGRVNQVGRGVGLAGTVAIGLVHFHADALAHRQLTGSHRDRVRNQARHRPLHILHIGVHAGGHQCPAIGNLATRLRIQRGFGEDDLHRLPCSGLRHRLALVDDAENRGLVSQLVIAQKNGFSVRAEVAIDRGVRHLGPFLLRIRLGAVALLRHERAEALFIHAEPGFFCHLEREVNGESVGVVQDKRGIPIQAGSPRGACLLHRNIQNRGACLESAEEGFLFGGRKRQCPGKLIGHFRVCRSHGVF